MATGKGIANLRLILGLDNQLKGGLNSAKKQVDNACGGLQNKISKLTASNTKLFEGIKSSVPGVGSALSMISNPYLAVGAAAVGAAVAIKKCVEVAQEWEKSMADLNVTAGLSKKELNELSEYLKGKGTSLAVEFMDVPKAFQMIIGSVNDLQGSKDLLEPVLKSAKAFGSELQTVAEALSAIFMSTGRSAEDVGNIMAKVVADGAAEFDEIAQFFPKILPGANQLKFTLEEVGGAFASMTGKLGARFSASYLDAVFGSLSDAGTIQKLKKASINVFNGNEIRSFKDIITDFKQQFDGLSDKESILKMSALGLNSNAQAGILSLMQNYEQMSSYIDSATNSMGALNRSYETSLTSSDRWLQVKNNLKKVMVDIGEKFLPILTKIGDFILGVIDAVKNLYANCELFRNGIGIIWNILKNLFNWLILPFRLFGNFFKLISAIKDKFTEMPGPVKKFFDFLIQPIKGVLKLLKTLGDVMGDILSLEFSNIPNRFKELFNGENTVKIQPLQKDDYNPLAKFQLGENKKFSLMDMYGNNTTKTNAIPNTQLKEDTQTIKGGSQSKVVNINFRNVVENWQSTNSDFVKMGKTEVEQYLSDILLRVVRGSMQGN